VKVKVESLTSKELPQRVRVLTRRENTGWKQGLASSGQGFRTIRLRINPQQVYLITKGQDGKKLSFGSGTLVSI